MNIAPLGYAPFLRSGASLFTIVCYQYHALGRCSATQPIRCVYGRLGGRKRNLFGIGAAKVSENVFGGSLSPFEILQNHTLFGIYSRALSQSGAAGWAKLILEEGKFERRTLQGMLPGRTAAYKRLELGTSDLRSCAKCVAEDTAQFGFAAWDVLHLLPPIFHCPKHGVPLVCEAEARPGRNLWKLGLPQGKLGDPKSTSGPPPSDGYARYLQLWIELFEGRLPVADFSVWPGYIEAAVGTLGSVNDAKAVVRDAVYRLWGLDVAGVSAALGRHVETNFVGNELSHATNPTRIAQKLVLITALESLGLAPFSDIRPMQMALGLTASGSTRERLRQEVIATGYSSALVDLLMSGATRSRVRAELGIDTHRFDTIVGSFTASLLQLLLRARPWPEESWLVTELRRRQTPKGSPSTRHL